MEKKEKDYGLGWFYFYIKWRFPISFVWGALSIINAIIQGIDKGLFSHRGYGFFAGVDIANYVFAVVVYINMRKLKPVGYTLNKGLITLDCLSFAMVSAVYSVNTKMSVAFWFSFALYMLFWGLPNLIYFKHRKFLFDGLSSLNDLGNSTAVERNRDIYFCDNCGFIGIGPIQGGTCQCPKCATTLTNTHVSRGTWTDLPQQGKSWYIQSWNQKKTDYTTKYNREAQTSELKNDKVPVAQFCRNCGTKLASDVVFCPNCGTKVIQYSKRREEPDAPDVEQAKVSDPPIIESPKEYIIPEPEAEPVKPNTESTKTAIMHLDLVKPIINDDFRKNLSSRLRRAFMLAEDGEWEKADEYFERALDEDPENAYAYVGKLLCINQVHSIGDLKDVPDIAQNKVFLRAIQFADDGFKEVLKEIAK